MVPRRRLLDRRQLRRRSNLLLLPFCFLLPLLVGGALTYGDLVKRAPLRFHRDVGVARERGPCDMPGDAHDHLIARTRLGELRNERVAIVVPPARHKRTICWGLLPRAVTASLNALWAGRNGLLPGVQFLAQQ